MVPLAAGILGSVVTTWVTFVPCFLWSTLDPRAVVIAAFAFFALFRWKLGMLKTLAASSAAGLIWVLATR